MHKVIIAILLICSVLLPAHAEGWYIAKNDSPTVMSEDGNWYMFLGKTVDGDMNVYLTSRNLFECSKSGPSQGMYVNGVKVRWYQNCDSDMGMYWYAYTPEGKKHLNGEFMRKQVVIIQDNNLTIQFSAKGFNEKTRDFINEIANPGL
ncbi:hypothetical protein R4P48_15360 [Atlantibacter subterranea]|uniref:Lipocalin-like domain-containing protein n=1 Tax=Atlantibacter subterraneus TaxID=255519 RepID=A0ABU4E4K1_9ENTR|nr:hypothetical protein [Atlantibacter subterranea]MDV7024054.1 hypothetical protein [Atlantibacter subterranea]MDZ5667150.1 hypothetical protein [Atlantibacter hermannii]